MNRVAAIITNYNMPEATRRIYSDLRYSYSGTYSVDVIVIDNASEYKYKYVNPTLRLPKNIQTTGGWLAGLMCSDILAMSWGEPYFAYIIIGTSIEIDADVDYITPMATWLETHPDAVGIMPALKVESDIEVWRHMLSNGGTEPRQVKGLDNLFTMWRADWFNEIGRFDPELIYGWGLAEETAWKARRDGRTMWIDERVRMVKHQDIGYKMDRMNMTAQERRLYGMQNVCSVMEKKYGEDWMDKLNKEYMDGIPK